jgi:hypothetical protein
MIVPELGQAILVLGVLGGVEWCVSSASKFRREDVGPMDIFFLAPLRESRHLHIGIDLRSSLIGFHIPSFNSSCLGHGRGISIMGWATALSDASACGVDKR